MAFSFSNLRKLIDLGFPSTLGGNLYMYRSTDTHSAVEAAGYFAGCGFGSPSSNASGMRVGDVVLVVNTSTAGSSALTWHQVSSLSTSTGFGSAINATVSAAST